MPELRPSNRAFHGIGHGIMRSLGTATTRMPLAPGLFLNFDFDVVDHDVPVIFGLKHHRDLKCSSNEWENTFTHHPSGTVAPLIFLKEGNGPGGHLYIQWSTNDMLFTKEELRKLHTQFGHPSTDALINILKKAKPDNVNPSVRRTLQGIADRCAPCQTWAPRSARFRVSFPMDNITFNHELKWMSCLSTETQYYTLLIEEPDTRLLNLWTI